MSWIGLEDIVRLIAFVIAHEELQGPVNATAPEPVRNRDFVAALGRALHRPAIFPVPGMPLELILGDFAREIILGGQRVVPDKITAAGFHFLHPELKAALAAEIGGVQPYVALPLTRPDQSQVTVHAGP